MASINQGDDAVERLDNAVTAFEQIMTGPEGQTVQVPGHQPQPTLAERVKQNLKPSTDAAAGYAAIARDEANRSAQEAAKAKQISGLETVADAVRLAMLPTPDVSIPFTTDGQLLHGKGTPVLVGTIQVAQMVSYERLGSQTMLDKSGRLVTVPAGEMAIEQQGLAIFDQSVNLVAPSINWVASAFHNAPWTHSVKDEFGWITVSGAGNPSAAEGSRIDFQAPLVSTYTFSMDVMKTAGLKAQLRTFGSNNGTTVTLTETTVTGSGAADVTDMGSYWRVEITRSFTGSANSLVRLNPFGAEVGASGSMTYRRVQFEEKPFATPYIENATSAQTTRPATTRCDIPWIGNMLPINDNQQLTVALEFDTAGQPSSGYHTLLANGSGSGNYLQIRVESGGLLRAYRSASATHQPVVAAKRRYRLCYRINRNTCDMFLDGVKLGATVTVPPLSVGIPQLLRIGYASITDRCLNGHLRSIDIWNAPLTDIQCQAASS